MLNIFQQYSLIVLDFRGKTGRLSWKFRRYTW